MLTMFLRILSLLLVLGHLFGFCEVSLLVQRPREASGVPECRCCCHGGPSHGCEGSCMRASSGNRETKTQKGGQGCGVTQSSCDDSSALTLASAEKYLGTSEPLKCSGLPWAKLAYAVSPISEPCREFHPSVFHPPCS